MIAVFIIVLLAFAAIGISSFRFKKTTSQDYLLASQSVPAWLVALSAVATNNSGYMFIGMIGYSYIEGLSSIWLMVGWILGDLFGSFMVYGRLRDYSEKFGLYSFGSLLANDQGNNLPLVQRIAGLLSLVFLSLYAAAQFNAGGKALFATLSIDPWIGVLIGCVLVVMYCFSGGIRASIWTDAAQSIVMIIAMGLLFLYAVEDQGGMDNSISKLSEVSTDYMSWMGAGGSISTAGLIIVGWFFAGLGVVGQPHCMVRFMTLKKDSKVGTVRWYYYSWFTGFYALAIGVGLWSRIVLSDQGAFDPELALPMMTLHLMPDYMVGIVLAGIFAATISTADSLIISCTAAVSNDLFPRLKEVYSANKWLTIGIAIGAALVTLWGNTSVFHVVIYAWAVLGSTFGPVVILRMLNQRIDQVTTISMILVSAIVVIGWNALGWGTTIVYEMLPGIISGFLVYTVLRLIGLNRNS